jgi:hypothetical protein
MRLLRRGAATHWKIGVSRSLSADETWEQPADAYLPDSGGFPFDKAPDERAGMGDSCGTAGSGSAPG